MATRRKTLVTGIVWTLLLMFSIQLVKAQPFPPFQNILEIIQTFAAILVIIGMVMAFLHKIAWLIELVSGLACTGIITYVIHVAFNNWFYTVFTFLFLLIGSITSAFVAEFVVIVEGFIVTLVGVGVILVTSGWDISTNTVLISTVISAVLVGVSAMSGSLVWETLARAGTRRPRKGRHFVIDQKRGQEREETVSGWKYCPRCRTGDSVSATICRNCGYSFSKDRSEEKLEQDVPDRSELQSIRSLANEESLGLGRIPIECPKCGTLNFQRYVVKKHEGQHQVLEKALFCKKCGKKLADRQVKGKLEEESDKTNDQLVHELRKTVEGLRTGPICPNCEAENEEDALFCSSCGMPMGKKTKVKREPLSLAPLGDIRKEVEEIKTRFRLGELSPGEFRERRKSIEQQLSNKKNELLTRVSIGELRRDEIEPSVILIDELSVSISAESA